MNAVFTIVVAMAAVGQGGRAIERGENPEEWLSQSVVLAKIGSVTGGRDRPYVLDLEVIATLTGPADAAKEKHISAGGYFGDSFTTEHVPSPNELVVVLIQRNEDKRLPWPCKSFCVRRAGARYLLCSGMRPSNMTAKWLRASFQLRIGIVHFLAAS